MGNSRLERPRASWLDIHELFTAHHYNCGMRVLSTTGISSKRVQGFDGLRSRAFGALPKVAKGISYKNTRIIIIIALFVFVLGGTYLQLSLRFERSLPAASAYVREDGVNSAAPIQELKIANGGFVYAEGARITNVSGNRLVAKSRWNNVEFIWIAHIGVNTRVIQANGEIGALSDLENGDFVNITGTLTGGSTHINLNAKSVRIVSGEG